MKRSRSDRELRVEPANGRPACATNGSDRIDVTGFTPVTRPSTATFILAMPPALLRVKVPNVRGDDAETQQTQRAYACGRARGGTESRGSRAWRVRSSGRICRKGWGVGQGNILSHCTPGGGLNAEAKVEMRREITIPFGHRCAATAQDTTFGHLNSTAASVLSRSRRQTALPKLHSSYQKTNAHLATSDRTRLGYCASTVSSKAQAHLS
jgi:hypothetical protein